eukprot:13539948-Alexandrium_andersonii.AAC.1
MVRLRGDTMRQALEYPFNQLGFTKYYNPSTWIEPNTGPPVTADNRADLAPELPRGHNRPGVYDRRRDLGKPDASLPRGPRQQAKQQKRIAGNAP